MVFVRLKPITRILKNTLAFSFILLITFLCLCQHADARTKRYKRYYKPGHKARIAVKKVETSAPKLAPETPWDRILAKADKDREVHLPISKGPYLSAVPFYSIPLVNESKAATVEKRAQPVSFALITVLFFTVCVAITLFLMLLELRRLSSLIVTKNELCGAMILGSVKVGKGLCLRLIQTEGGIYVVLVDTKGKKITSSKIEDFSED